MSMREYSKVGPKFWIGKTGKALRKQGTEALLVAAYLMTAPNSNMLGLYYLLLTTIAHETGLGMEGAAKGLQGAIEAGFCAYDEEAEMVWVFEMAKYQIAEELNPNDKQCIGIQKQYNDLPENKHLCGFYEKYAKPFHMKTARGMVRGSDAPSKPLGSQEQEQDQEQKSSATKVADAGASIDPKDAIFQIAVPWLVDQRSVPDARARSLLGGAVKAMGADLAWKLASDCMEQKPVDPMGWLSASINKHIKKHGMGKAKPGDLTEIDYRKGANGDGTI